VRQSVWSVQVASSSTTALANDFIAKLGREGFPGAYSVPDGAAYKVRVGKLPARADADALLVRVRAKYPSAFVVEEKP
jgi:cell division septation protein DedD